LKAEKKLSTEAVFEVCILYLRDGNCEGWWDGCWWQQQREILGLLVADEVRTRESKLVPRTKI